MRHGAPAGTHPSTPERWGLPRPFSTPEELHCHEETDLHDGVNCLATGDPRAKWIAGVPGCAVTHRVWTMLLTPEQTCALLKACSCADEIATPSKAPRGPFSP